MKLNILRNQLGMFIFYMICFTIFKKGLLFIQMFGDKQTKQFGKCMVTKILHSEMDWDEIYLKLKSVDNRTWDRVLINDVSVE